ncbi:MAG TPA: hypothetical protein VHT91_17155 [Kofleriaceae bacterium]|jgi:hypothetical protein|nr:hypothetical protein [Kofleriaceae bacterium]
MSDPITRVEQAIEQLGAGLEPPPGWEARVMAAVEPRRRSWLARGWFAIPALAAIALVAVLLPRSPRAPEPLALSAELVAGSQVMRGPSALRAIARGGGGHRAIWIYRDGRELAAACPGHPACESSGDALRIVLDPVPIGSYQIVALSSASALPAATGSPDHDLAAATDAGATWKLQELEVR